MKYDRPTVLTRCVADQYHAPHQRIIEISDRETGLGCLISLTRFGDGLRIHVYRADSGVEISGSYAREAPRTPRRA